MIKQTYLPYTCQKYSHKIGIRLNSHNNIRLRDNVITFDFDGEAPLFESVEFLINNNVLHQIDDPDVLKKMIDGNSLRFDTVEDNITIMNSSYDIPLFAIPDLEYRITPKGEGTYSNIVLHTTSIEHTGEYNKGVLNDIHKSGRRYYYKNGMFEIKAHFNINYER